MTDPADSIVSSTRSSPLRTVAAALALVGVAGAGIWLLTRGKGADEDPARVLIIGPTPELSDFLERKGFDVSRLSLGEAIGQGQAFDDSLDDLPAMLEYADQNGFGYLALNMAHGERYDFSTSGYEAADPPPGTTFAVVSVGDLGAHLSYGAVTPEVTHLPPAAEQVGLLLALFGQPEISKARDGDGSNDLQIRFGAADTIDDVLAYEKAQASMARQVTAWHALAQRERAAQKPIELARPYELLRGWPLANGSLLLAAARDAWRSTDGLSSKWVGEELEATLSVVSLDAPEQRIPCATLPETIAMDGAFSVAPTGDALLIPTDAWIADLYVLTGADCSFEKRDPIRRLDGGALGLPRASGRTAASEGGRIMWADAKLRSYQSVALDGVAPRPFELQWLDDEVVVVPVTLDFVVAAQARLDRMALAADPSGASMTEAIQPIIPATQPLPPADQAEELHVAAVPIEALLNQRNDAPAPTIHSVHPLASKPGSVVVVIVTAAEIALVRATIAPESWFDAHAIDYDLVAVGSLASTLSQFEQLASLPLDIRDVAISANASHVAWAAPLGGNDNSEINLLELGVKGVVSTRLTDNDRRDAYPRFVGSGHLVFDSSYTADDDLPAIEAMRALAIPTSN
jgi:hypothetical protein